MKLPVTPWSRTERVGVFRKRVRHQTRKDIQLDLFDPNDGSWESVVATNKKIGLVALWHFANGRGVQEKTYAELKGGYAFGAISRATVQKAIKAGNLEALRIGNVTVVNKKSAIEYRQRRESAVKSANEAEAGELTSAPSQAREVRVAGTSARSAHG